jgi:hypothetical protein
MNQLPSSEVENLKSELIKLYEKRLVVDELIRSLERYAACETRRPMGSVRKSPTVIKLRNIA